MRTILTATATALGIAASIAAGVAAPASAAPSGHELLCLYQYVVTDGKPNNVAIYANPHGSARAGSIRPGDVFFLQFGTHNGVSDHIGSRQRINTPSGVKGWVTYPRDYLQDRHSCLTAL